MNMAGFFAESALYKVRESYSFAGTKVNHNDEKSVVPQMRSIGFTIFGRRCFSIDVYDCDDDCISEGGDFENCCTWAFSDLYC